VTTINIADGPRASLRMGNVAMAVEVQRGTGLSPLVHVCCRDRNFLGLQSHLLGAHVLGLRNLVVITGDPPKMGPYPHATGVYDVDSIGLLHIINGYNHGIDPSGKPMPEKTSFVCATGAEPAAIDYDRELRRLELKKEAGAVVVMTQPVYDPLKAERFLDDAQHLGLPIMLGVCPLASFRNATFLHENVPGMQIPGYILERMKQADEQGRGQEEGVAIAREALEAVRDRIHGAYVMPPFGRYKVAMQVLEGFVPARELPRAAAENAP
jgi:homocysteine S-methyltransferase